MNQLYLKYCSNCKKKTKHRPIQMHLKKGYKLQCLICFHTDTRYTNLNNLEEVKE